jgi:meiotic recombination protein SPO11
MSSSSAAAAAAAAEAVATGKKRVRAAAAVVSDDEGDGEGARAGAGTAASSSSSSSSSALVPSKRSAGAGAASSSSSSTAGAGAGAGPSSSLAADSSAVLRKVGELVARMRAETETSGRPKTLAELGIVGVKEVAESAADAVLDSIEAALLAVTASVLAGEGFSFDVPTRNSSNVLYVPELDRIVLQSKTTDRSFTAVASVRKAAIMARVLQLVYDVLRKGIHVTKRDLFYTDVKLFRDQAESDVILDDVAAMLGCTRTSLHVVASDKGIVVGRLQFRDDGDLIDCTRMGIGGKAIPPFIDKITDIRSDAQFILLIEKEAAFMRVAEDRFYNKYPCIVITAKGQPDVATRLFLKKLKATLGIPVLGLVDSDPYGLKILSVYMSGSKNMSYDSASLTTPDIKWLGVRPSDLDKYKIPEQCRLPMTANDIKTGTEMMKEDFIRSNPAWLKELELMVKTKEKAEIQSLSSFDFQYLTQVYLPKKIAQGDWI